MASAIAGLRETTGGASTQTAVGNAELGKDQFVKLLLAQMANQDPTAPQDSSAFVAQLAQFSNVELLQTANSTLESLVLAQAAGNQTSVTSLVGKDVRFRTDAIGRPGDAVAPVGYHLDSDASDVVVTIRDANGNVVRSEHRGPTPAGDVAYAWDGKTDRGLPAPPGDYTVSVSMATASGEAREVPVFGEGHVDGVSFEGGVATLMIGALKVSLGEVVAVKEPSQGPAA